MSADTKIVVKQETEIEFSSSTPQYIKGYIQLKILSHLNGFYKEGILPTFDDVYNSVKFMLPTTCTFHEFYDNLTDLGYISKKMPFGDLVMEKPEVTFERYFYLKNITKVRQSKNQEIYYLDQRIIDISLKFPKPTLLNCNTWFDTGDNLVFLYIISASTGKVNGLFTNHSDSTDFNKWIADIVLSYIEPNSLIVVDEYMKCAIIPEEITMYDTKDDILKCLKRNGIPCSMNMCKAELFEIYKKYPKYKVKMSILESHGHQVLYLPTSLPNLCPTNALWEAINTELKPEDPSHLLLTTTEGKSNLMSKIEALTMPTTVTDFLQFEKVVKILEKDFLEADMKIEKSIDILLQRSAENTLKVE